MSNEKLLWVDIETTGLDVEKDVILEVGFVVTDLDLKVQTSPSWVIRDAAVLRRIQDLHDETLRNEDEEFVFHMHTNSGLFEEVLHSDKTFTTQEAEQQIALFLLNNQIGREPLCGSSVGFDKKFLDAHMSEVTDLLHYRIIDNSTLKELCRRYNPRVYENIPPKNEEHRAIPDCMETIEEFRFYRDEFLLW